MTLHEQYDTLLRRGMPGHPRLLCRGDWFAHAYTEDDRGYYPAFPTDDVRDLLTMHALRWLASVEHDTGAFWGEMQFQIEAASNLVLGAIIAATAHLEPA